MRTLRKPLWPFILERQRLKVTEDYVRKLETANAYLKKRLDACKVETRRLEREVEDFRAGPALPLSFFPSFFGRNPPAKIAKEDLSSEIEVEEVGDIRPPTPQTHLIPPSGGETETDLVGFFRHQDGCRQGHGEGFFGLDRCPAW